VPQLPSDSSKRPAVSPRGDALRANTTKDRRFPGPASTKEAIRESPNSPSAVLALKPQPKNGPVAERRAFQPPTAPQQQSAAVANLAKTAGATPRRKKNENDQENDPDIVKRLQRICMDTDPTRLYHNLVKIREG
jgi:hypothetical protein